MPDKKKNSTIKHRAAVKQPAKTVKAKSKKGGFNLAPLITAVLLAGIKLSLEQRKIVNKNKTTTKTKSISKSKSK